MRRVLTVASVVAVLLNLLAAFPAAAEPIGDDAFWRVWARADKPIVDGVVQRSWMWGPEAYSQVRWEEYRHPDLPGNVRKVQYFDKSRMEITYPSLGPDHDWYVTQGRAADELISGLVQVGELGVPGDFVQRTPAAIGVAGDPNDQTGPTYATFNGLRTASAVPTGATITTFVNRGGMVSNDGRFAAYGVTGGRYEEVTQHTTASVFQDFIDRQGPLYVNGSYVTGVVAGLYAVGYPVTEAYWARVTVAALERDVLVQCFERRCLTYTPSNDPAWRVEMGNIGQHYYRWMYGGDPPPPPPPSNDPPVEGAIVYQSSLGNWPAVETSGGIGGPSNDRSFYIAGAYPEDMFVTLGNVQAGDASYRVDIRSIVETGDGVACLIFRASQSGAYWLCLAYVSGALLGQLAFYDDFHNAEFVDLGLYAFAAPRSPEEWTGVKVIAQGSNFWFYDGNTLVGHVQHHGSASGYVGVGVICIDSTYPCVAGFRNLVVRSV
jgi:hypothetical protein